MGNVKRHVRVKLFIGFIFRDERVLERALRLLSRRFGPQDAASGILTFGHTAYYEPEFGTGLRRRFISFGKLIRPDALPEIKIFANTVERRLTSASGRTINIDPGYLTLAKVVLATTKDYSHRIYMGKGIFAEVTLSFGRGVFRPREWTYPDYRTEEYLAFFGSVRRIYADQIRRSPPA